MQRLGPQAVHLGITASSKDVILADIQRCSSPEIDHRQGPFAFLVLWMVLKQSKSSVSAFVELNFPKQPQAVRHAIYFYFLSFILHTSL
jgi:hypothetical protein